MAWHSLRQQTAKPTGRSNLALADFIAPRETGIDDSIGLFAVSAGFYLAHPESRYFAVGKIGKDQVEDYARHKGWTLEETERWLAPALAYER